MLAKHCNVNCCDMYSSSTIPVYDMIHTLLYVVPANKVYAEIAANNLEKLKKCVNITCNAHHCNVD